MQVTCPNCGARYAVDPMAIGAAGRTVQCVRCSHRWRERPISPAAVPPPARPVPDFVIRPPVYNSGLPALTKQPTKIHWAVWLVTAAVIVALLGLAAWAFRSDIYNAMPDEWRAALPIDALREQFRELFRQ
jgi:predicted Zn finger-like uncharacterized protein